MMNEGAAFGSYILIFYIIESNNDCTGPYPTLIDTSLFILNNYSICRLRPDLILKLHTKISVLRWVLTLIFKRIPIFAMIIYFTYLSGMAVFFFNHFRQAVDTPRGAI